MSKLTRNGIAYDLKTTPYLHCVIYEKDGVEYRFSSELYKEKFIAKLENHREKINESLSNRFGFNVKNNILSDLKLYTTIEKRGFLIFYNGVPVECQDNITLDGHKMIMKS